jgi:hypothetical protein
MIACGALLSALVFRPSKTDISQEAFHSIQEGMTESDVNKVLGRPPLNPGIIPEGKWREKEFWGIWEGPGIIRKRWAGPNGGVGVYFDNKDGKAIGAYWCTLETDPELSRLRQWFGL